MPNTHSTLGALFSDIADSIRAKDGTSASIVADNFPSRIDAIPIKEDAEWHQCPTAVKNYLDNVTYDPSDYTTSQIGNYAPATAVSSNTKPVGKTIDGVTYYNEEPNKKTPFASTNKAGTVKPLDRLRWINSVADNVRDLGGWNCDGGTIKYGRLFRGGELSSSDRAVLVGELGMRHEMDLRGSEVTWDVSPLGADVKLHKYNGMAVYGIQNTALWKQFFATLFDASEHNEPLIFHCTAGADRTGTLACIVEGLLGVSQSDVDKDYELTTFYSGSGTDANARRRNEADWIGLITEINAKAGNSFMMKCVNFVASLGFTADEINAFRRAMINGTPSTVTPAINTATITNTLTNVTSDNAEVSKTYYQHYEANLTPTGTNVINSITVTMGGVDITANVFRGTKVNFRYSVTSTLTHCTIDNDKIAVIENEGYGATITAITGYTMTGGTVTITMGGIDVSNYYSNGKIAIPQVTGNIVITATAVPSAPSYTNQLTNAHEYKTPVGLVGGVKAGYYLSTSSPYYSADASRVLTGIIDISKSSAKLPKFYIKGISAYSNSHDRLGYGTNTTTYGMSATKTLADAGFTVENLGTNYYSFQYNTNVTCEFIAFSLTPSGNASDIIITFDEAIE